jgi:hypothetical protein
MLFGDRAHRRHPRLVKTLTVRRTAQGTRTAPRRLRPAALHDVATASASAWLKGCGRTGVCPS